ncbi:hypothetical protein ACFV9C_23765 [Kribbella sp. NPDC059898]|uniref:hypothetical protein n=1 Tax=Kribbella sp. NPDC059898 TaxID=3346995 RepID=UPI003663A943
MTAITVGSTSDYVVQAYGYIRKHFLMSEAELAKARHLVVDTARRLNLQLIAIHVEEIETSPEAFHDLLAAVMRNEQRTIIAPDIQHFEVAGDAAVVAARLESNGIKIIVCG